MNEGIFNSYENIHVQCGDVVGCGCLIDVFRNCFMFDVPEKGALLTFLFSLFSFSGARHLQNFTSL